MNWKSDTKDVARRVATLSVNRRPAKNALFLPGPLLLCVKRAMKEGLIDRKTYNIFVERDMDAARKMLRNLKSLNFEQLPYMHAESLCTLDLDDPLYGDTLDYAFIDVCACLTASLSNWLQRQLLPAMRHRGYLAITLARQRRTNRFMEDCADFFSRDCEGEFFFQDTAIMIGQTPRVGNTEHGARDADGRYGVYIHHRPLAFPGSRQLYPRFHPSSVLLLTALRAVLHRYSFTPDCVVEYKRDSTTVFGSRMVTFRLAGIQQSTGHVPTRIVRAIQRLLLKHTR